MGVVDYWTRMTLRERWRSYAGVVLLLGLTGGLSLFAIAGARRTQSSYPRFLRSANASTLALTYGGLNDRKTNLAIAALPDVRQSRTYVSFNAVTLVRGKPDFSLDPELVGTPDGRYFAQDRFAPTHGRRPDPKRADEAAVNEFAARTLGYRLGQRIELGLYSTEQYAAPTFFRDPPAPKLRLGVTIVGIGLFPDEVLQDDGDRTTRMLLTQAFTERAKPYENYSVQGVVWPTATPTSRRCSAMWRASSPLERPPTERRRLTSFMRCRRCSRYRSRSVRSVPYPVPRGWSSSPRP